MSKSHLEGLRAAHRNGTQGHIKKSTMRLWKARYG